MQHLASGTFSVRITPAGPADAGDGTALGRSLLDKTYFGPLDAHARGEMLSAITGTKGSAVYVAIERVEGTLDGRRGTFCLAHRGRMARGEQALEVGIVPDSGTGELAGISGELSIRIAEGQHYYELRYDLPG
jgi:hypothetical protein